MNSLLEGLDFLFLWSNGYLQPAVTLRRKHAVKERPPHATHTMWHPSCDCDVKYRLQRLAGPFFYQLASLDPRLD